MKLGVEDAAKATFRGTRGGGLEKGEWMGGDVRCIETLFLFLRKPYLRKSDKG
jgi:hypothetical protein